VEEYFATCPWMNDLGMKRWIKWINFIPNVANKCYFFGNLEKKHA
jgi:hypothetical protein